MPEIQRSCNKVNHFGKSDADLHAADMKQDGYDRAYSYKCRHCPFWHVTKGQRRRVRMLPNDIDLTTGRRKHR